MSKKILLVLVILGLLLTSCAGKSSTPTSTGEVPSSTSAATSAPSSTSESSSASTPKQDVSSALNRVLGSTSEPSVFASYHIDIHLDVPQLSDDATSAVNKVTDISADVQGANVHIIQTDPGATESKEGFIIGEKEYKMIDGKPEEMMGQIALGWAMWPLQVIMPYAYAAYFGQKTGSDSVDGRAADIYTFDTANADAVSASMMSNFGMEAMTTGKGTVWIDQETGAMLKLDMTYVQDVQDYDQKVVGSGTGIITIQVSKVNQVEVTSPL